MEDTLNILKTIIHEHFGVETKDLDPTTSIMESGLDSLGVAELIFFVEDRFGIEFPELRTGVRTLSELALLVDTLRQPALVH